MIAGTAHGMRLRSKSGAALVEFVLVLPLLLLLVFGMIEMGLLIKDKLALNQVAREGARCAAVGGSSATVTARVDAWATKVGLKLADLTTVSMEYTDPDSGAPAASPPPIGSDISVTVTYNHHPVTGILPILPNPTTMQTTMVMRLE